MYWAEKRFTTTGWHTSFVKDPIVKVSALWASVEYSYLVLFVFTIFKNMKTIHSGGYIRTGSEPGHSLLISGLDDLYSHFWSQK